jgi:hypothetical protein
MLIEEENRDNRQAVISQETIVKFKNAKDIKYYLYVSTTKLNMLYEQIASHEPSTEEVVDRDDKLNTVEKELDALNLIGTPEEPKDYFKSTMRMRWGLFDDNGTRPEDEAPLVYFGGFEKTIPLIVGLGGSSKHVVGHDGATSTNSRSCTPTIVRWLFAGLEQDKPPASQGWRDKSSEEQELFAGMASALHYLRPPTQDLEFLAKTLTTGTIHRYEHFTGVPEAKIVLGTPLYVVLKNPMPDNNRYGLDNEW